jgi:hypothetical protein
VLERGRLTATGGATEIVNRYLSSQLADGADDDLAAAGHTGDGRARFTQLALVDAAGRRLLAHVRGDDLRLRACVDVIGPIGDVALAIVLSTLSGARVITSWTREVGLGIDLLPGQHWFECCFRAVQLRPGHAVSVSLWMESQSVIDSVANAKVIHVTAGDGRLFSTDANQGIVALDYAWSPCDAPAPVESSKES